VLLAGGTADCPPDAPSDEGDYYYDADEAAYGDEPGFGLRATRLLNMGRRGRGTLIIFRSAVPETGVCKLLGCQLPPATADHVCAALLADLGITNVVSAELTEHGPRLPVACCRSTP